MSVVPDYVEPVSAWRSWNLIPNKPGFLFSFCGAVWRHGEPLKAFCLFTPKVKLLSLMTDGTEIEGLNGHSAPDNECTCGIYAVTEPHLIPLSGVVVGRVNLWGRIIPGERGYRAEYAYPAELYVGDGVTPEHRRELEKYGVPVKRFSDIPRVSASLGFLPRSAIVSFVVLLLSAAINLAMFFTPEGTWVNLACFAFVSATFAYLLGLRLKLRKLRRLVFPFSR